MQKLTAAAWAAADPAPVTQDNYKRVHVGDRCWHHGCNRLFETSEQVAYTVELGDSKPVCASYAS